MKYIKQLILSTENRTLLQKIQYHLNEDELVQLNKQLYKFAKKCVSKRVNPTLEKAVYLVKTEYRQCIIEQLNESP